MKVQNFNELVHAIQNREVNIQITRSIFCNHAIFLPDGTILNGIPQENNELPLLSFQNSDGIGISSNNKIYNLNIDTPTNHKAIFNTSTQENLGDIQLEKLFIKGQVSIITRVGVKKANIMMNEVDIHSSDSRHYLEQPQKYGVNVLQGALTIYNINPDPDSCINVSISNLSIGRKNAPVTGSGVFISGFGDTGGKVHISILQTQSVYSNGKIPLGVADYISAGVFIVYGAHADQVITDGEVITYGVNDMVLDVWGNVDSWISYAPIISYGPSGVGFVNFGIVKDFTVHAPLQTYGLGARGYNQYDGTVDRISFKSIETFGDGSVGIQISKKIGSLTVHGDITTHGSVGSSLVKGIYIDLPAYALSIKNGGEVENLYIGGNIISHGDNVTSYIAEAEAKISSITIGGEILATGKNAKTKND
jgi:hypothetical protein